MQIQCEAEQDSIESQKEMARIRYALEQELLVRVVVPLSTRLAGCLLLLLSFFLSFLLLDRFFFYCGPTRQPAIFALDFDQAADVLTDGAGEELAVLFLLEVEFVLCFVPRYEQVVVGIFFCVGYAR